MHHLILALVICLTSLTAHGGCSDSGPAPTEMMWDPGAGEMWAFPDDALTIDDPSSRTGLRPAIDPDRVPDLADVPDTFKDIIRDLGSLDGWGLSAGVTLRFSNPIDTSMLPSGEATADPTAPIVLAVEQDGTAVPWPYELIVTDEGATLILEPMVPLPPKTQVFVAVSDRIRAADGSAIIPSTAMSAALKGEGSDATTQRIAPRIAAAAADAIAMGVAPTIDNLLGVIVFTTQSMYEDALAIAEHVRSQNISLHGGTTCATETLWIKCTGTFTAVDYRGADGFIEDINSPSDIDASTTYDLAVTVWLPLAKPGPYGGSAYPVLMYGHGLGGGRSQGERLAEFAAPRGMATVAIDALRHGYHPTAENFSALVRTLDFFGISAADLDFEPLQMREHFRQSTFDKLQLIRMLSLGVDLDGDTEVDLDPQRIGYLGVSLGGIMGPELLALAPEIGAGVLVVPGGRVSSIVRDADQFSIVIDIMKPENSTDGEVARFFPLLQTILERGDAANWATHLLTPSANKPAGFPAAEPHLLMGMVIDDDTVPNTTNRVLARALNIPVVPPLRQDVGIVGMTSASPVSANLSDGRTAGLLQFDRVLDGDTATEPATHSNIGDSEVGAEAWFRFLDSWIRTGTPVIVDPYIELGIGE